LVVIGVHTCSVSGLVITINTDFPADMMAVLCEFSGQCYRTNS
jgi:hypothetical protein